MIDKVQKGDFYGMIDEMKSSLNAENVVPKDDVMYFVWLNLSYLFDCTDERAINEGLKCAEYIKPSDPQSLSNWLGLKARLFATKGDYEMEKQLREEAKNILITN